MQKMIEMGMDFVEVQDFLDDKCIHEENAELVIDHLQNPGYMNPLKANFVQAPNAHANLQAQGYGYMPDARKPNAIVATIDAGVVTTPGRPAAILEPIFPS